MTDGDDIRKRIYFDTEFIEDGRTIDLLSIGLVREDGATYYAEVDPREVDYERASVWVRENVFPSMSGGEARKSRAQIAVDIVEFVGPHPEFWAYYADYDWVALCQLYGRMMDLPEGWPMFCRDFKQWAVERGVRTTQDDSVHNALGDAMWLRSAVLAVAPTNPTDDSDRKLIADARGWAHGVVSAPGAERFIFRLCAALEHRLAVVRGADDELIREVRALFDEGWCICRRSGLGDRVLEALEGNAGVVPAEREEPAALNRLLALHGRGPLGAEREETSEGETLTDWRLDGPMYHFWGDEDWEFVNTSLIVDSNRNAILAPSPEGVERTRVAYEAWQEQTEAALALIVKRIPRAVAVPTKDGDKK